MIKKSKKNVLITVKNKLLQFRKVNMVEAKGKGRKFFQGIINQFFSLFKFKAKKWFKWVLKKNNKVLSLPVRKEDEEKIREF